MLGVVMVMLMRVALLMRTMKSVMRMLTMSSRAWMRIDAYSMSVMWW